MNSKAKTITHAAILLALGAVIPQAFHLLGGTGPVFLPMHIPVLLAGFFLGSQYGAMIGFLTVLLSFFITGMPQVPILYFMLVEVTIYGLMAGLLYRKMKLNIYISLISSMIVGRIALAITVYTLQPLLGIQLSPKLYIIAALTNGIPGIIIQLIFIPIIVLSLDRAGYKLYES